MQWMAWTPITAWFFITIGLILMGMTVWQLVSPTVPRKGFLPIVTTRGDRLFIGLLGGVYILLLWIGLIQSNLWYALALAVLYIIVVMRWG
ncbi:DUF2160 domain-containing protein [Desulfovibrio inopinatus]|uniref:DUF2160 domain-containing protein n=1 Tax=Desulfovibrio inopinatus TaxID=102109 RepID=UPI0003F87DEB|nr:DUF2160 domain-containing protein [Desulfovibrio inopinatus]